MVDRAKPHFPKPGLVSVNRRTILLGASAAGAAMALGNLGNMGAMAQGLKQIKVSEAIHLGIYASLYAAKHGGYFRKNGLDVSITSAGGIAAAVPVLLSGNASFAVTGTGMSVNAANEGASVRNVAKVVGGMALWAVAKPGVVIKGAEDFKGKTIATLRFPSSTMQVITYILKKAGMTPESAGVKFLQMPPGTQAQAVLDGRADFASMFEWDVSIAKEKFGLASSLSLGSLLEPMALTSTMATRALMDKEPGLIQAYCNALAEAQAALHADRELFVSTSMKEFPQVSEAVIRSAAENLLVHTQAIPKSPLISKADWDLTMAFELDGGSIKAPRPFEEMVDNSFAEKAVASLKKAG